jgi:hypothetical protein
MASRPARPEDFEDTSVSMDHLITEFAGWNSVLDRDDYDLIAKTKALYRFAMNNYNEPGRICCCRRLESSKQLRVTTSRWSCPTTSRTIHTSSTSKVT